MTNTKKVVEFSHPMLVLSTLTTVRNGHLPGPAFRDTLGELVEAGLVEGHARFRLTAAGKARLDAANRAACEVAGAPVELLGRTAECAYCGALIEWCGEDEDSPGWMDSDGSTACDARTALWHEPSATAECQHCGALIKFCGEDRDEASWLDSDGSASCRTAINARTALWHEPSE